MVNHLHSTDTQQATLKFRSEKSRTTAFQIFIPVVLILATSVLAVLFEKQEWVSWPVMILLLLTNISVFWMWFDTGYEISPTHLFYHCGPIRGKIEIATIRKVEKKKQLFGGVKPALGQHGIILYYNKYEDIYLSPENQEAFIQELKSLNPQIELAL